MEILSFGTWESVNVVSSDKFSQGRCVMTPVRLNVRNDDRSPLKSAPSRAGAG